MSNMSEVTFIIVNRGGKEIDRVVKNFNETFKKYFSNIEFIIVEQRDNLPFKRGQLYNIGVGFCKSEYIGLIDNDIINLDSFDPIQKYNEFGGPYVSFDVITQIRFKNGDDYEKLFSEKRPSGFGAFDFMKRDDFMKVNGFSNLCIGWGAEDNILNEKIKFKRFVHALGHITHPKRVNKEQKLSDYNKVVYKKYLAKTINGDYDGCKQTTFRLINSETIGNVTYLMVDDIGVSDDFKYKKEYNEIKTIECEYNKPLYGYSICITAYKSKNYIKETLDSVFAQTWFKAHDNWEVIVGIDGCKETLDYLKTIMSDYKGLNVYMMDSNKGTYITTNTIMTLAKYENLIRFDSDDIMKPTMIDTIDAKKKNSEYMNLGFVCFGNESGRIGVGNGSAFITKTAFEKCGGYQPWICAADYDLKVRANELFKCSEIKEPLFERRVSSNSLQYSNETGMKSEIRMKYHEYIENETKKHLVIKKETNSFKTIYLSNAVVIKNTIPIKNKNNSHSMELIYGQVNGIDQGEYKLRKFNARKKSVVKKKVDSNQKLILISSIYPQYD